MLYLDVRDFFAEPFPETTEKNARRMLWICRPNDKNWIMLYEIRDPLSDIGRVDQITISRLEEKNDILEARIHDLASRPASEFLKYSRTADSPNPLVEFITFQVEQLRNSTWSFCTQWLMLYWKPPVESFHIHANGRFWFMNWIDRFGSHADAIRVFQVCMAFDLDVCLFHTQKMMGVLAVILRLFLSKTFVSIVIQYLNTTDEQILELVSNTSRVEAANECVNMCPVITPNPPVESLLPQTSSVAAVTQPTLCNCRVPRESLIENNQPCVPMGPTLGDLLRPE